MSRTRQHLHPDSVMLVRGNGIHSTHSATQATQTRSQENSKTQSTSPTNLSHNMLTHAINYGEILSRRDPIYRAGNNRPSPNIQRQRNSRNTRNQSNISARIGSNRSVGSIPTTEDTSNSSTSSVNRRLGHINRLLRNNISNINQSSSSMSTASPVASIQTSHDRLARQQQNHYLQNQQQRNLRNLMIQQHQQSLQMQQRIARQHQHQLQQHRLHNLISILSENESILRSREERDSQLHRISTMSDEALSIIERIHSNLEQREDEEIFGIEYVDDNDDLGIDEEMERVIENTLYENGVDHSSDEFDAEDENGNIIHVVKRKMKPNVPVTNLEPREITDAELKSGLECPICISEFVKGDIVAELKCGHMFHNDCVSEWVKKHPTCPVCRASTV